MACPGAVLTHRTALQASPTASGTVFVSGGYDRVIDDIPGLKIRQIKGPGPFLEDHAFLKLYIASQARALTGPASPEFRVELRPPYLTQAFRSRRIPRPYPRHR